MKNTGTCSSVLDKETAEFIQLYTSMNLATRNSDLIPAVTRAFGCRVADDLSTITLFIRSKHNQPILDNINNTGVIAAIFTSPSTHKAIQLKGVDARLVKIETADLDLMRRYHQSMIEELQNIGFPPDFTNLMVPPVDELDTGICFTPGSAFIQTPGPKAGARMTT